VNKDREELELVCEGLRPLAEEFGVDLKVVEIKGTVYFLPLLEADKE